MSSFITAGRPLHPMSPDDKLAALSLQMEELAIRSQRGKGKHPADHPPDFEIAFASFSIDLQRYKTFLDDQKLAQSIAAAAHSDSLLIGDLTSQEVHAHEDRRTHHVTHIIQSHEPN